MAEKSLNKSKEMNIPTLRIDQHPDDDYHLHSWKDGGQDDASSKNSNEEEGSSWLKNPPDPLRTKPKTNQRPTRGGVSSPFPLMLHSLLERREYKKIISWQPHGRCFILKDQKGFVKHVMPHFFKQTKFTSFQRQLNLYGFHRIYRAGPDKGAYYHNYFLRGQPDLTAKMYRTRIKGCSKKPNNPSNEPDFYKMPFLPQDSSLSECPDHQEVFFSSSPSHEDDHKNIKSRMHNFLPPRTINVIEDCSSCDSNHQEEEKEVKMLEKEEGDCEIGIFAGIPFTCLHDDDNDSELHECSSVVTTSDDGFQDLLDNCF
jgi:hypothetical protein